MVERHPPLESAGDLDIGGVQVDRHFRRQRGSAVGGYPVEQVQRGGVHVSEPGLQRSPLPSENLRASPAAVVAASPGTGVNA
ncbi:MAG: hypothetical protein AB7L91_18325 [Dehalococcoidia bacterium]